MSKHTPGPWAAIEIGKAGWVDIVVVQPDGSHSLPFVACKHFDQKSNARRIVACVNRLEKFTTEQVEDFGYDLAGISSLQNQLWVAQHQRNELLALLQELIDIEGPQPGTAAWADKARAAIAKATNTESKS